MFRSQETLFYTKIICSTSKITCNNRSFIRIHKFSSSNVNIQYKTCFSALKQRNNSRHLLALSNMQSFALDLTTSKHGK